jgi:hypothetical protein
VPEEEDDVDELEGEDGPEDRGEVDWGDKAGIDDEVTSGITKLGG